jgi:ABC-type nitrate/sulfonate/bicarbonate transport system permease component
VRQALQRLTNASDFSLRLVSLGFFVLVWAVAALLAHTSRLPTPWAVAESMVQHIVDGDLVYHVSITLARVVAAFVIAMTVGTAIGIVMGRLRELDVLFDGWLVLGLNIPALVVIILCYIWMGLTDVAAVVAVALNKIPLTAVTVREGARAIDRDLLQVAQIYRFSWSKRLTKVILPQLVPYIMAAARGGLALIWKIVLVVELLGRSDGVGFQLSIYFQYFDISSILAYTLAFVGIVLAIEMAILRPLEKRLTRWRL